MAKIAEQAFVELEAVYERLTTELEPLRRKCEMRGICCDFAVVGHMLYVTGLEAEFMSRAGVTVDAAQAEQGRCPFLQGKVCGIRDNRAIGCRLYYCDKTFEDERNALYERYLKQVREIEVRFGIEHSYRPITQVVFQECVNE